MEEQLLFNFETIVQELIKKSDKRSEQEKKHEVAFSLFLCKNSHFGTNGKRQKKANARGNHSVEQIWDEWSKALENTSGAIPPNFKMTKAKANKFAENAKTIHENEWDMCRLPKILCS